LVPVRDTSEPYEVVPSRYPVNRSTTPSPLTPVGYIVYEVLPIAITTPPDIVDSADITKGEENAAVQVAAVELPTDAV